MRRARFRSGPSSTSLALGKTFTRAIMIFGRTFLKWFLGWAVVLLLIPAVWTYTNFFR